MTDSPLIQRIRGLVDPIASDLGLDVYDVEQRGGTLRVTLDTEPGSPTSVDLQQLALATRLISRELDHTDPVPGRYTLEVTSPGVERSLRIPAHFQREVGKTINVRLANADAEMRRLEGVLVAADERTATIQVASGPDAVDHVIEIASIDRARTVFVWGPQPKPGKSAGKKSTATRSSVGKTAGKKSTASKLGTAKAGKRASITPESSIPESSKEPS